MQSLNELIEMAVGNGSRNEFCRRAGISAGNFSRILKGQKASPEILRKIADASATVSYSQLMQAAGYVEDQAGAQAKYRQFPFMAVLLPGALLKQKRIFPDIFVWNMRKNISEQIVLL